MLEAPHAKTTSVSGRTEVSDEHMSDEHISDGDHVSDDHAGHEGPNRTIPTGSG
jgi:hypothetical protein